MAGEELCKTRRKKSPYTSRRKFSMAGEGFCKTCQDKNVGEEFRVNSLMKK